MTESMRTEVSMMNETATITIDRSEYKCIVEGTADVTWVEGDSGSMKSGSSSYEDVEEVPSAGEIISIENAVCTVVILDHNIDEIGELKLVGIDWFDRWFHIELDHLAFCG
jgi:hypothetical protein